MTRKLKAIGPVFAALLAMALLSASASAGEFHSEASETVLSGEQIGSESWTFEAGTFKCNSVTYSGTQSSATATEVTLIPEYEECTAFGFVNTLLDRNGCVLITRPGQNPLYRLFCGGSGGKMIITAFNCWVTIPNQDFESGITLVDKGAGKNRDRETTIELENLKYEQDPKGFPGCKGGVFGNGKTTGTYTIKGANKGGEQAGIWSS